MYLPLYERMIYERRTLPYILYCTRWLGIYQFLQTIVYVSDGTEYVCQISGPVLYVSGEKLIVQSHVTGPCGGRLPETVNTVCLIRTDSRNVIRPDLSLEFIKETS